VVRNIRRLTKNPDSSVTGNAFGGMLDFLFPFVLVAFLTLFLAILDLDRVNKREKRCREYEDRVKLSHTRYKSGTRTRRNHRPFLPVIDLEYI
jgi:large-conductance mechanosensitive channel